MTEQEISDRSIAECRSSSSDMESRRRAEDERYGSQAKEIAQHMDDDFLEKLIKEEHERLGFDGNYINDTPEEMPKEEQPYEGVRFFVNVNDAKNGESVTMHVIHGTWSRRENKRRLRKYLAEMGYTKHDEQKRILKGLGFWTKKQLGTQP